MREIINSFEKDIAAQVARLSSSESAVEKMKETLASISDEKLKKMARIHGLNRENAEVYAAFMKGKSSVFNDELEKIEHWLQPGDIILMAGTSKGSQSLVKLQKGAYSKARSSHVAIVYADHICIDAMPGEGVQLRMMSQVLKECDSDWRVLRFEKLDHQALAKLVSTSTFFLMQPYKIKPSRKSNKKYTYCSELARKIYFESKIKDTKIPNNKIIKPCDFDRLADQNNNWIDVTEQLRPAYELISRFEGFLSRQFKYFYMGIRLNRERFDDRLRWRKNIRSLSKKGYITKATADKLIGEINSLDKKMNNQFWDAASIKSRD